MTIRQAAIVLARTLPLLALGALLVSYRHLIGESMEILRDARPFILLNTALFLVWNLCAARGWRHVLVATTGTSRVPTTSRLSLIRIEAQAVNLSLPLSGLGGEALRSTLAAADRAQLPRVVSATVLDNVLIGAAGVLFAIAAFSLRIPSLASGSWNEQVAIMPVSVALIAVIVLLPIVARTARRRLASDSVIGCVLEPFTRVRHIAPALLRGLAWHLLERILIAGEIYLTILALGMPAAFLDAAFVSAVVILISFTLFFIPGQLGAADVGIVAACAAVGLPAPMAITIALVRRLRQLLFCAGGLVALALVEGRSLSLATAARPTLRPATVAQQEKPT